VWNELYGSNNQPTSDDIISFVGNDLWGQLCGFLETEYKIPPKIEYSCCTWQPGWNVKYKKGGRSLCTLYPMKGFFIALVTIGSKEQLGIDFVLPYCTPYLQEMYNNLPPFNGGRWLMIHVTNPSIMEDVKKLVQLRAKK
jgi:hypothetical protein